MQSFQDSNDIISGPQDRKSSCFSPFLAKTLEVKGHVGFFYEYACYNFKYNMIIACSGGTMQFYDATTFELRHEKELKHTVAEIAFHPETDTYLLGCEAGSIHKFNISTNELKMLKKSGKQVLGITFLNSTFYVFSLLQSDHLYVGNLDDGNVLEFSLNGGASQGLCYLSKERLLFAGLRNGFVKTFRKSKLPHLKAICSVKAEGWVFAIQCINVNKKDYIITASEDWTVRIWHLLKGKMRLLKVTSFENAPYSMAYLEKYKMIVVGYDGNEIHFFQFPSLKLARKIDLKKSGLHYMVVMKDKNMMGVTNENEASIDFFQLSGL